ncbi:MULTISPECIES: beta-ketoacyl-[acyl-carrier-protein] synthase family protein [Chitinophagaceae]
MERIVKDKAVGDNQRVVITGIGVVCPNAIRKEQFLGALKRGASGIRHINELEACGFRCQVAGIPPLTQQDVAVFKKEVGLEALESMGILYGLMAGREAWMDAGLLSEKKERQTDSGCIFGCGSNGIETTNIGIHLVDTRRIAEGDQSILPQTVNNGVAIYLARMLGLGGQVMNNASACSTGTEALLMGYEKIKNGEVEKLLVGSSESGGKYVWGPFDSMFATAQGLNGTPEKASCPLSENANGFVPAEGGAALTIESLASAKRRDARIYAEILGGHINSGGQRGDGTMTLGNLRGMERCIKYALKDAGVFPGEVDLISGHLTSTIGDVYEMKAWGNVWKAAGVALPVINAPKSLIGHALSASGAIEAVAVVLQLYHDFIHPSLHPFPLHPLIAGQVEPDRVPTQSIEAPDIKTVAKVSLGFGDVNSCILFRKWENK